MSAPNHEVQQLRQRVAELEALLAAREGLDHRAILDAMFEGVQVIGFDTTYLYLNETAAVQGQRSRHELLGQKMTEVYPGIDQTQMFALLQECLNSRLPRSMVNEFTYPHGASRWFDLRMTPVPMGALILSIDVTDYQNSQAALRASRANLAATLDCMGEGVITTDVEGRILRMNPAAERMSGWSLTEARDRRLADVITFVQQSDGTPVENTVQTVLRHGLKVGLANSIAMVTRSGDHLAVATSGAPLVDKHGKTRGVVLVIKDMQEEYNLLAQLQQAQKMEAVGQLASGVAHDFNNLLTAIFSFSQFVMDELPEDAPAALDIREVLAAAQRAEALTKQLLAFSRKRTVHRRVVDINGLIDNISRMLERVLGKHIDMRVHLEETLWHTSMDPSALEQVLVNLAVNARDAIGPGGRGGKLTIETSNVVLDDTYCAAKNVTIAPGRYVCLSVSDNGPGMPAEVRERIFDPFFTTKPLGAGTGLGLATCYNIVKQAGGHIQVYSEPGRGSTFKVFLPRVAGEAASLAPPATGELVGGRETILLVEDDIQVRNLITRVLEDLGYRVLPADSAPDALRLAEQHGPQVALLLTDVVMPHINGPELAERVAQTSPHLKVLFISGYSENTILHHGLLQPGLPILQKPFVPEALGRKVRAVLDS